MAEVSRADTDVRALPCGICGDLMTPGVPHTCPEVDDAYDSPESTIRLDGYAWRLP